MGFLAHKEFLSANGERRLLVEARPGVLVGEGRCSIVTAQPHCRVLGLTPCREFPYRLGARIVASLARPEGNLDRPPNGNFDHRVSVTCLTPPDGDSI